MEQFITIHNTIINKNQIKTIHVEKDVEQTNDYDYPNGLRPTDIYIIIHTLDDKKEFKILDDDFHVFINFVKDFYEIDDYLEARSKAIDLMNYAPIRNNN